MLSFSSYTNSRDWIMSPHNSYPSTSICDYIWNRTWKEVITVKWDHMSGLEFSLTDALTERGHLDTKRHQGRACRETQQEGGHLKATEIPHEKPDILILDFQPPELWKNKFVLFKSPLLAALVNWYTNNLHEIVIQFIYIKLIVYKYFMMKASQVAQWVKDLLAMQEMPEIWVPFLDQEDSLEEGTTTHFSILAWRIP